MWILHNNLPYQFNKSSKTILSIHFRWYVSKRWLFTFEESYIYTLRTINWCSGLLIIPILHVSGVPRPTSQALCVCMCFQFIGMNRIYNTRPCFVVWHILLYNVGAPDFKIDFLLRFPQLWIGVWCCIALRFWCRWTWGRVRSSSLASQGMIKVIISRPFHHCSYPSIANVHK